MLFDIWFCAGVITGVGLGGSIKADSGNFGQKLGLTELQTVAVEVGIIGWFSVKEGHLKRLFCELVLVKQSDFEILLFGGLKGLKLKVGWFSLVPQFDAGILLVDGLRGLKPGGGRSKLKGSSNFCNWLISGSTIRRSELVNSSDIGELVNLSDFSLLVVKGLTCEGSVLARPPEIGNFVILSAFGIMELTGLTCERSGLFNSFEIGNFFKLPGFDILAHKGLTSERPELVRPPGFDDLVKLSNFIMLVFKGLTSEGPGLVRQSELLVGSQIEFVVRVGVGNENGIPFFTF